MGRSGELREFCHLAEDRRRVTPAESLLDPFSIDAAVPLGDDSMQACRVDLGTGHAGLLGFVYPKDDVFVLRHPDAAR